MLYSVRMRAAQGGDHAAGGRHISGAERLVPPGEAAALAGELVERALGHSRGRADFINVTVEAVAAQAVRLVPIPAVRTVAVADATAGRTAALEELARAGVSAAAALAGMDSLAALPDSMRGAMILCAACGRRLDGSGERGIRVSRMDAADGAALLAALRRRGLANDHVREALVLAAKVAAGPGMAAELCWSDDPEYTAGYVASRRGYCRFAHLKEYGCPVGGRVFFAAPGCDVAALVDYLERQPVLATLANWEE